MSVTAAKSSSYISESMFLKETSSQTFSANYVIHAYEQGRQRGMKDKMVELESDAKNQFAKNRDYTIKTINNLITDLITEGVITQRGWIKSEGLEVFDVVIAVPQENYLAENFERFYIKANQIETESNSPEFHLNIRFINGSKPINEEKLFYDGYKLKFEIQVSSKTAN
jgi:hypothetical protein